FSCRQTDQAEDMFEPKASWSSDPAGGREIWEPRSGSGICGRLFLVTFFGEVKKVTGRRATPG
ncbi:hypothetical protein ACVBEF_19155, partial [Glaciimonas sp. GG7]